MCLTLSTFVSIAQIIGVFVALCALAYQIWRSRFSLNIQLVLEQEKLFNSEAFKSIRSDACREMLDKQFTKAENVFDFFETLGYLVDRKVIDDHFVWHTFYDWIHGYWSAGVSHINKKRHDDKDQTLWESFEYLHTVVLQIQKRNANRSQPSLLDEHEIVKFLNDEIV